MAIQVMPIRKDSEHRFCVAFEAHKTGGKLPKWACRPCNPDHTEKGMKYMRQRTTAINIRVTEGEKRKMETAAKKCGLSLSAYLRKLGLGKEVQATLPQEFYEAYRGLTSLRDNWKSLSEANVNANFNDVVSKFLNAYHSLGERDSASDSPWQ